MRPFDSQLLHEGDDEILQRVREHAAAVDRALPPLSGPDVRRRGGGAGTVSIKTPRRRAPLLAATASAALVLIVAAAAAALNRSSGDTAIEAVPAADIEAVEQPSTTMAPGQDSTERQADEAGRGSSTHSSDLMPVAVQAADFGAAEVRYLPSLDSGFVVSAGSELMFSEADLTPEVAAPVRWQRVSMPAADPLDRRSIMVLATTFADEASADAVIEAEPTAHGVAGEPMDVEGRVGAWHEERGFAPYSAGNPMRVIGVARVRLDETTMLDVAAVDVPRAEIEALISSIALASDGSLVPPLPPAGFDAAEPIEGPPPNATINRPSASGYLSLGLVGLNGEQVDLSVSAESHEFYESGASVHFGTPTGHGWIEFGLFRETIVSYIGSDAIFVLTNYDGQVSTDELIALGESMQLVDDETWTERLAIAPLFQAPVGETPLDD